MDSTPQAAVAGAFLASVETRLEQLTGELDALRAELAEAKRDPLADLLRIETFVERYDFTEAQLRWWISEIPRSGAQRWLVQQRKNAPIWIDCRAFFEWLEERRRGGRR